MLKIELDKQSLIDYLVKIDGKKVAWASREKIQQGYIYKVTLIGFESVDFCRNLTEVKAKIAEYHRLGIFA